MTQAGGEDAALRCLVISDGRRGIENQALGLAEACARLRPLTITQHRLKRRKWSSFLQAEFRVKFEKIDLPDCDIAIGCGRRAIPALIHLKRTRSQVFTIYIQDPRLDPSQFDLVVAPEHDAVTGQNVISMLGSPNRITVERLERAQTEFADAISNFCASPIAFLIGGKSKRHKLSEANHNVHIQHAKQLLKHGHSIWVTMSRRTPDFARQGWVAFAKANDKIWLYDGDGPNPYFAFLAKAKMMLVTEDSTNMLTEACATGRPVFRLPMTGKAGKFQNLYDSLEQRCNVMTFSAELEAARYQPLNETDRVAQRIWKRFPRTP